MKSPVCDTRPLRRTAGPSRPEPAVTGRGLGWYPSVRPWLDRAAAAGLLVLTAPLLLAAAAAVRLTSRGPAFYTQVRLGRNRVPFRVYKVRTMAADCERASGPRWSTPGDPRVIPVGRLLRRLHIDELPQLVNVLRGEMSLIGPRPERPGIAAGLAADIPGYWDRLAVLPGITGLAQVQFPPDEDLASVRRKQAADVRYIDSMGPGLDVRIAAATALSVLHLPESWRRAVLGPAAEPSPPDRKPRGLWARLDGLYGTPAKPGRIEAVQGLRAVAASLVFLTHFMTLFAANLGGRADGAAARAVDLLARTGTDLFLLISGFLIYGMAVRRPLDYGRFLRNRARRIYPAFLCVFAVYLALSAAFPSESKIPADPAAAARYLAENLALLPGLTGTPPVIVVTWTLGYELLLYATVPLAVRLTGMRAWPAAGRVAVLAVGWAGFLAYRAVDPSGPLRPGAYFAGFLAYEAVGWFRRRSAGGVEAVTALAAAAGFAVYLLMRMQVITVPSVATAPGLAASLRAAALGGGLFALAWCCFGTGGLCGRALSLPVLRWFGNMSYSFYLTHGLTLKAAALAVASLGRDALHGPAAFFVLLPLCYAAAVAVSTVLFVLVEKPLSLSAGTRARNGADGWVDLGAAPPRPDRTCLTETVVDLDVAGDTARHEKAATGCPTDPGCRVA